MSYFTYHLLVKGKAYLFPGIPETWGLAEKPWNNSLGYFGSEKVINTIF
ncbi:hypothetical protein SDC9_161077 [bioreactor metagenome]|uniref:Uncharacterized protein n=1 Tax=bioreactor metagenome TaxID=1076179 RepID=A0A645FJP2_9ZZZZ